MIRMDGGLFETPTLPITIIGVGGVGSRVAEGIVRMGYGMNGSSLTLIDADTFEEKNLANQLVFRPQVGHRKVDALAHSLLEIQPKLHICTLPVKVGAGTALDFSGIVFLCLDSMQSRREIVEHYLENNLQMQCVIETRMDSNVGISHCFDPRNHMHQECWWLHWHPDNEAENGLGCGGHYSVISAVLGTAMLALRQFEQYLAKKSAFGIKNRMYVEFDSGYTAYEAWPA